MKNEKLTLDPKDPAVIAACEAEIGLYQFYGLEANDYYIQVPRQDIKMGILEIGTGEPVLNVPGNTDDVFPLATLLT